MKRSHFGRLAIALGLLVLGHGCAARYETGVRGLKVSQSAPGNPGGAGVAAAAAPHPQGAERLSRSEVAKAVAYEGRGSQGSVRQVAGESPISAISSSIKGGVDKVTGLFRPEQPTASPSDPTSLASHANPGPELYVAMGHLSEQTGRPADAEQQYQKALEMAPGDLDAIVAYARFRDRQGRLDDAVQLYRQAAKAHPSVSSVHNDLGLCLARSRDYRQAAAALARAVELEPNRKLYRNNLATVLVELGDNEGAYKQLAAVHGEAIACYNLGYLLEKKGQTQQAAELFAEALQKDPSLVQAKDWLDRLQNTSSGGSGQPAAATASHPALPSASASPSRVPFQPRPNAPIPGRSVEAGRRPFQAERPEHASNPSGRFAPWRAQDESPEPARPTATSAAAKAAAPLPPDSSVGPLLHPLPPVDASASAAE